MANSAWIGTPSPVGTSTSNRTRNANAQGQIDAYGYQPDPLQEKKTGVDVGGGGYVSGQVAPAGAAPPPSGGTPRGVTAPAPVQTQPAPVQPVGAYGAAPATVRNGSVAAPIQIAANGTQSGNNAPGSDITTRTSNLNSGQPTGSGTTNGQSPIPTQIKIGQGSASPSPTVNALNQVSPGLGDQADIGGRLLTPSVADLSPTTNAMNTAFTAGSNYDLERYNYRPGAAASQDRVSLDTTNPDQIRARQLASLNDLSDAAHGAVPSAAELQLTRQASKDRAANLGAARALGGRSAAGAARAATMANAEGAADLNVSLAAQRAAEQAQARSALVAALSGTRGQDIDISQSNANLNQQANANNLASQNEQNKLAEQHRQALIDAQLKAYGIGTNAASAQVTAAAKNAEAENEGKKNFFNAGSSFLGL